MSSDSNYSKSDGKDTRTPNKFSFSTAALGELNSLNQSTPNETGHGIVTGGSNFNTFKITTSNENNNFSGNSIEKDNGIKTVSVFDKPASSFSFNSSNNNKQVNDSKSMKNTGPSLFDSNKFPPANSIINTTKSNSQNPGKLISLFDHGPKSVFGTVSSSTSLIKDNNNSDLNQKNSNNGDNEELEEPRNVGFPSFASSITPFNPNSALNSTITVNDEDGVIDDEEMIDDLDFLEDEDKDPRFSRFEGSIIPYGRLEDWSVDSKRTLKYKLNPASLNGIAWISSNDNERSVAVFDEEKQFFTNEVPGFDGSDEYISFISKSFKNFHTINEDFRKAKNQIEIGIFNSNSNSSLTNQRAESFDKELFLQRYFRDLLDNVEVLRDYKMQKSENLKDDFDPLVSRTDDLIEIYNILSCLYATNFSFNNEVPALVSSWINRADPDPSDELVNEVITYNVEWRDDEPTALPLLHYYFWPLVNKLLIRGMVREALAFFEKSGYEMVLFETDPQLLELFSYLIDLLRAYPHNQGSSLDFRKWKSSALGLGKELIQTEPSKVITSKGKQVKMGLKEVFNILSGDTASILSASDTWYESLCGLLYYHDPTKSRLDEYFNKSIEAHPVDQTALDNWELCCYRVLNGEYLRVLLALQARDLGISCYTAQLLLLKGTLDDYFTTFNEQKLKKLVSYGNDDTSMEDQDLSVYEYLILEHALACSNSPQLIKIGIELLFHLYTEYEENDVYENDSELVERKLQSISETIEEIIYHFYVDANVDLNYIFNTLNRLYQLRSDSKQSLKLSITLKQVYKILAKRYLDSIKVSDGLSKNEFFYKSMILYYKSEDFGTIRYECWKIFENLLIRNQVVNDTKIARLLQIEDSDSSGIYDDDGAEEDDDYNYPLSKVPSLLSECLAPYAILYEYFKTKKSGDYLQASKSLFKLLKFKYLPKKYFLIVLDRFISELELCRELTDKIKHNKFLSFSNELVAIIGLLNKYESISSKQYKSYLKQQTKKRIANSSNLNNSELVVSREKEYTIEDIAYYNEYLKYKTKSNKIIKNTKEVVTHARILISNEVSKHFLVE